MKKRFIKSMVFALIFTMLIQANVFAEKVTDIDESEFKVEIEKLIEDGIIKGYPDNTFRPLGNITRSELSTVLVRALDLKEDFKSGEHFIDAKDKWYQGYVGALHKVGIIKGKTEKTFVPNDNITRQELAVILIRAFGLEEAALELKIESDLKDFNEIPNWAKYSVSLANKIGLMKEIKSKDVNLFEGSKLADRQLVAKLVYELKYNKKSYEDTINKLLETKKEDRPIDKTTDKVVDKVNEKSKEKTEKETKPSYDSIVEKYVSKLTDLEEEANKQVDDLISQAKAEYKANKNTPGFSVGKLYDKYMEIGTKAAEEIDKQVNTILSDLESELTNYGYDTDIISELQAQYEESKSKVGF